MCQNHRHAAFHRSLHFFFISCTILCTWNQLYFQQCLVYAGLWYIFWSPSSSTGPPLFFAYVTCNLHPPKHSRRGTRDRLDSIVLESWALLKKLTATIVTKSNHIQSRGYNHAWIFLACEDNGTILEHCPLGGDKDSTMTYFQDE
jgi:hypothetical protein